MALNMNYQPVSLVDTSTLTNEEWLQWRKKGIGGSDVAAALNLSPYRTMRDLYYDKIGVEAVEPGEDKSITFEIGHLLEDVVAKIFAKKTGLTVYRDQTMYQHPLFPFMLADVDRFITLPNGEKAILECKTAHYDLRHKWANGAVPRHYELQVKHYLSVMNLNTAFIACLFSNSENDFVWVRIDRDLDEEEETILQLERFWNDNVLARNEPPLIGDADQVLDTIRRYYGQANPGLPTVKLSPKYANDIREIMNLKEAKKEADAASRRLDKQIKSLYSPIVAEMGAACEAECYDGVERFEISYLPESRTGINKAGLDKLKAQAPDMYDALVETSECRKFKVVTKT